MSSPVYEAVPDADRLQRPLCLGLRTEMIVSAGARTALGSRSFSVKLYVLVSPQGLLCSLLCSEGFSNIHLVFRSDPESESMFPYLLSIWGSWGPRKVKQFPAPGSRVVMDIWSTWK